jgi:transposase-like protein
MSSVKRRVFSREFKLSAVKRILDGVRGLALSNDGSTIFQLYGKGKKIPQKSEDYGNM